MTFPHLSDFLAGQSTFNSSFEAYQLASFNKTWLHCLNTIPFYQAWAKEHSLPLTLQSLDQLSQFPVLTKSDLRIPLDEYISAHSKKYLSTGGSTGAPLRFPVSTRFSSLIRTSTEQMRKQYGIIPHSPSILIWGHSHIFGRGFNKYSASLRMNISDILNQRKRFSAYNLSSSSLKSIYEYILSRKPKYLIGYTSCVSALAHYLLDNSLHLPYALPTIVTSESLDQSDHHTIKQAFLTPPIIEYGMSETGALAYGHLLKGLSANLATSILHCSANKSLICTTLNPFGFPFIRYDTNDLVEPLELSSSSSVLRFNIYGRANSFVYFQSTKGGIEPFHSELITHIIKSIPSIDDFYLHQHSDLTITLYLQSSIPLSSIYSKITHSLTSLGIYTPTISLLPLIDKRQYMTLAGKRQFIKSDFNHDCNI